MGKMQSGGGVKIKRGVVGRQSSSSDNKCSHMAEQGPRLCSHTARQGARLMMRPTASKHHTGCAP